MFDHLSLGTSDLARAITFYDATLATLGRARIWRKDRGAGYGAPGDADEKLAIKACAAGVAPSDGFHLAFTARSREEVDAFFRAAVASGGVGAGAPGLRAHYGPGYYAAFVHDPDGHHIEAVFHEPRG